MQTMHVQPRAYNVTKLYTSKDGTVFIQFLWQGYRSKYYNYEDYLELTMQ